MKADKAAVSRLLKTARGQIEGILKMVEEDRYCMDISFNESMLGYPLPDSHFEIAVLETNNASASSSCVKPRLFLNF